MKFFSSNLPEDFSGWWLGYLLWNCPQMNVTTRPYWWQVNIGSGNGWQCLSKSMPPICHLATMSDTEPRTKWSPLCRRHFQIHFMQSKLLHFYLFFLNFISKCPIDNLTALVSVMAWLHQARNYYLTQFWQRSTVRRHLPPLGPLDLIYLLWDVHRVTCA